MFPKIEVYTPKSSHLFIGVFHYKLTIHFGVLPLIFGETPMFWISFRLFCLTSQSPQNFSHFCLYVAPHQFTGVFLFHRFFSLVKPWKRNKQRSKQTKQTCPMEWWRIWLAKNVGSYVHYLSFSMTGFHVRYDFPFHRWLRGCLAQGLLYVPRKYHKNRRMKLAFYAPFGVI